MTTPSKHKPKPAPGKPAATRARKAAVRYADANHIEFHCVCGTTIAFSMLRLEPTERLACGTCAKSYFFNKDLVEKMRRFERLLLAVRDAKDLLGSANVGITVGAQEVKVPYRLLLTRLNTTLTLDVNGMQTAFCFRIEPLTLTHATPAS